MALIDDPRAWILRLFEMEEREGRGANCVRFPDGIRPENLPLNSDERVFGIFKGEYHFTAESLIIGADKEAERIPWAEIRSCSSQHGEGKTDSELTLANGRKVGVKIGDMATGWSGRISQLYHQMIERHSHRAPPGRPLMTLHEFLAKVTDDFSIAPNLVPHPPLSTFHAALCELEKSHDGTEVLMQLVSEEEEMVADGLVIVTSAPKEQFQRFADEFRSDGVLAADERTLRHVGPIPDGCNVWQILWD